SRSMSDNQVQVAVGVEVRDAYAKGSSAYFELARRLKSAVSVAEQFRDKAAGAIAYGQVLLAILIEIADHDGERSVRHGIESWRAETAIAVSNQDRQRVGFGSLVGAEDNT